METIAIFANTVEQEIFANLGRRQFVCRKFSRILAFRSSIFTVDQGAIRVQEIFANLRKSAKFAKISCTRKFAVLQYAISQCCYAEKALYNSIHGQYQCHY